MSSKEKKRCFKCNKKIKVIGYDCKCDNIFCTKCRLPEDHSCIFDFKSEGKKRLGDSLVKVIAEKITKI